MTHHEARWLFVSDPWDTLDHPRDTSLRIAQEALREGVECFWSDVRTVGWSPSGCTVYAHQLRSLKADRCASSARLQDKGRLALDAFTVVLYRTDPPVDLAYLHPLHLMMAARPHNAPEFVNPIDLIALRSEKLEACCCAGLMPPSIASSEASVLLAFGQSEGVVVAKPLHQCQSKDVHLLRWRTDRERRRSEEIVRTMTRGFSQPVLLQRYLPGVMRGETRLWFVDGELIGVVQKKPGPRTFRIDMDKGGSLMPHELTERERQIVPLIARHLCSVGARLAAVDAIDGYVTDFNFTSPGLLPGMEQVLGSNLAGRIVHSLLGGLPRSAALSSRPRAAAAHL